MKSLPHFYLSKTFDKSRKNSIQSAIPVFSSLSLLAFFLTIFVNPVQINAQVVIPTIPVTPTTKLASDTPRTVSQIILNGRTFNGAWLIRNSRTQKPQIYLSDAVLEQLFGADLLSTSTPAKQPLQWFSAPTTLTSAIANGYRYLDITAVAQRWGWQIQTQGNRLIINTPTAQIQKFTLATNSPSQVLVSLSRPTPWQLRQELPRKIQGDPDEISKPVTPPNRDWTITLDGTADAAILQRYAPPLPNLTPPIPPTPPLPNLLKQLTPLPSTASEPLIQSVEVVNNQTLIRLSVPFGFVPRISTKTTTNPVMQVDIVADALVNRQIAWADGINWRQQMVSLGNERFPIHWLEINPRLTQINLRPIVTNHNSQQGTAPLLATAQKYAALAAINGGYFNRNNRLPLGAIRHNGQWLSGPILNRGAIAWNNSGQFYFGRLALIERLVTNTNQSIPILYLNSGFVQSGLSRYTPAWGSTYTTMTNNEVIVTVQKNQIIKQINAPIAGDINEPIPRDGYLLVFRGTATASANTLAPGSSVRVQSSTQSSEFNRYPHIIGAGPLLIQNRQVVLDGEAEKFGKAFMTQKAVRSAICNTSNGRILIAAVHNRAAGAGGPTLTEHAQLMQKLGCVNALNLDGGSSTSLYLGGQLVDRSANTAARVHNGIGIFLQPRK